MPDLKKEQPETTKGIEPPEELGEAALEKVAGGGTPQHEKWQQEAAKYYGLPCFPVNCPCHACNASSGGYYSVWCGNYTYDTPIPGFTRYNKARCFACGFIDDYDLPGRP